MANGKFRARLRICSPGLVRTFEDREIRGANDRSQSTADVDRNPPAAMNSRKRSFEDKQLLAASKLGRVAGAQRLERSLSTLNRHPLP